MCETAAVPPIVPRPDRIHSFATEAAFERWLRANHAREDELWLRVFKKASGRATVTTVQALDVALCWGWIDGIRKSLDAESFLQRYTPRRPRSLWSQVNRDHIARLMEAGRMQPSGIAQVDKAKADGRWAAAYAPIRSLSVKDVPADLMAAINATPRAKATFDTLDRTNIFALIFRTNAMKTPEGRSRKIVALVEVLARDERIVPGTSQARVSSVPQARRKR